MASSSRSIGLTKEIRGFESTAPKSNHRLAGHNKREELLKAHNKEASLLVYTSKQERFCREQRITNIKVVDTCDMVTGMELLTKVKTLDRRATNGAMFGM